MTKPKPLMKTRNRLLAFNLVLMAVVIGVSFLLAYNLTSKSLLDAQRERLESVGLEVSGETSSSEVGGGDPRITSTYVEDGVAITSEDGSVRVEQIFSTEMRTTQESLDQLLLIFVLIGLLILAVVGVISWFVANRAIAPMQEALEQQSRFVADASHELRTPLAVIKANAEVLRGNPNSNVGEQMEFVQNINEEASALSRLTTDLLLLAQQGETQELQSQNIDLSQLLAEKLASLEVLAFERDISLESHLASDLHVSTSPSQLSRLLAILLENALKYAGAGGQVQVLAEGTGAHPQITITNSGAWIPPNDLPHIFERFYRVDKVRGAEQAVDPDSCASGSPDLLQGENKAAVPVSSQPSGYGLGLSVAKELACQLGIKILATSRQTQSGNLTTFTLRF